jgi:hypothetical protein
MTNMGKYRFDPGTHTYFCGANKMTSVTTALKPLDNFDYVDPLLLERKGRRGTNVHSMVEQYEKGDLDEARLTGSMRRMLSQYVQFTSDNKSLLKGKCYFERPLFSEEYMLAGTPDIVSRYAIIDIKTRPIKKLRDCLQLAGYDILLDSRVDRHYYVLELMEDGYQCTKVAVPAARDTFLRFLDLTRRQNNLLAVCKQLQNDMKWG